MIFLSAEETLCKNCWKKITKQRKPLGFVGNLVLFPAVKGL